MPRTFWSRVVPAAFVLTAVALGVVWILTPPTKPVRADLFLGAWADDCRPEPREQLAYLVAITVPAAVFWCGAMLHRSSSLVTSTGSSAWAVTARIVLITFIAAMVLYQECREPYFGLGSVALAVVGSLLVMACFSLFRPSRDREGVVQAGDQDFSLPVVAPTSCRHDLAAVLVALVATLLLLLPGLYFRDMPAHLRPLDHSLTVQMGEFEAILAGRTALVDFFPQYQVLVAYALSPIFHRAGLDFFTFSLAMNTLSLATLGCLYLTLRLATRSPWPALVLYLATAWLSFIPLHEPAPHQRITTFNYFAVGPLRYLGPCLCAALLAQYLGNPSPVRRWGLLLAGCLAALNNLDFGFPALVATVAALLFTHDGPLPRWRWTLLLLRDLGGVLASVLVLFSVFSRLRGGAWPDLVQATLFQRLFALTGFYMLPMPGLGLHWVIYLTFLAAIARGLHEPDRRLAGLLLYSGVFGCGAAMYFVGRSHHNVLVTLFPAWGLVLALLAVATFPALVARFQEQGVGTLACPSFLVAVGLVLGLTQVCHTPSLPEQMARLQTGSAPWPDLDPPLAFVRQHTARGEHVVIIAPHGHLIAHKAKVTNVFPFVQRESLILRAQLEILLARIDDEQVSHVFVNTEKELALELTARGFRPVARAANLDLWEYPARGTTHD